MAVPFVQFSHRHLAQETLSSLLGILDCFPYAVVLSGQTKGIGIGDARVVGTVTSGFLFETAAMAGLFAATFGGFVLVRRLDAKW